MGAPSDTTAGGGAAAPAASPVPANAAPVPVAPAARLPAPTTTTASQPPDAASALEHARASYEYGDIDEMVGSARQVSDGSLHPTSGQRASALRYLGIGLFLTGRTEGAETAFFELLRLRPETRLDPQTTRPDVVAFFEQVRQRYAEPIRDAARANNRKVFAWNLLPPAGQVQNGRIGTAIVVGGIELVSAATATITFVLLKSWQGPHHTYPGHEDSDPVPARAVRDVNWISVGVLGATFLYGIIDGIAHYSDPPDDAPPAAPTVARFSVNPSGLSLTF
ncbi:MAG: hypothetical protein ABI560_17820 [Myxococcales bacterium]